MDGTDDRSFDAGRETGNPTPKPKAASAGTVSPPYKSQL